MLTAADDGRARRPPPAFAYQESQKVFMSSDNADELSLEKTRVHISIASWLVHLLLVCSFHHHHHRRRRRPHRHHRRRRQHHHHHTTNTATTATGTTTTTLT